MAKGKKILIVDDEPDVARYLFTILQANGFDPTVAYDVESGLEQALEMKPSLICLDIVIPKETGISMYRQLKENSDTRSIPVIIISGAEQEDKFDFRAYMPDESIPPPESYMEKPVNVEKLVDTVKRLTGNDLTSNKRGGK